MIRVLSLTTCLLSQYRRRSSADSGISFLERALNGLSIQRSKSPAISEQSESPEDSKGALGLNLLHVPSEPLVDFIFVHGLGGGSRKTWSKSTNLYHYWPKEWLPRDPDFKNVRVSSFGYAADWGEKKDSVLDIGDFARSLLGEIKENPEIRKDDVSSISSDVMKISLFSLHRLGLSWLAIVWVDW